MSPLARLDRDQARSLAERAARRLARDPRVRLVYLFGSTVDPDVPAVRDVDLAVQSEPALDLDELLRLRAEVVTEVGGPLDLVSLNDASIVLAREVAAFGICLYAKPPEAKTDFVVRANARYLDFKYYLDEQWRLAGERLEERLRGQT